MLKKMIAFAVCLCAVATLVTLPVSADCTSYYSDSFESGSGSVLNASGDYYVSSGDNGVLVKPAESTWSTHVTLSEDMGYGGTGGLYIHADTSKHSSGNYRLAEIMTRGVTLEEGTAAVLKYRVKFLELENMDSVDDSTWYVSMSGIGGSETGVNSTRTVHTVTPAYGYEIGKWYTVVTKVTGGTTAAKTVTSYVLNEDNTVKRTDSKTVTIGIANGLTAETQPVRFWPIYVPMNNALQRHLVVDDVTLAKYTTADTQNMGLDAIYTDIADGDTDVAINKSFHLTFDHDLANGAQNEVKLYKSSDMNTPLSCTASAVTFNSFTLTPDELLETGEEYVLDLSGVTSASGQTFSNSSNTITFTTVQPEAADPVAYVSAQTVSGAGLSLVPTDDSIKLTFDREILLPEADTDVVLYKTADPTKTVSVAIELSDDAESITVTPTSELSLGTGYTIDFSGVLSTLGGTLEGTSTVAFTTAPTRDMIYLLDNLEDATVGGTTTYSSDILTNTTMYINIANGEGFEGGKGLIWDNSSNPNSTVRVRSQSYALDERETLFFEYKMRLNDIEINVDGKTQAAYFCMGDGASTLASSGTSMFKIVKINDEYVITNRTQSSAKRLVWDRDTWYTVIYEVGRNAQVAYLMDEDGNVVLESSYTDTMGDTVRFIADSLKDAQTYINMNMDDFKVYRVQNDVLAFDENLTNIADGDENVGILSKFTLTFNQPLSEGAQQVFSLYEGDTQVSAEIKRVGGNEIRIAPAAALKPGRSYTIRFDDITALSGNDYGEETEIGFTTKKIYDVNAISSDVVISESGALSSGSKTLVVDNTSDALSGVVVVAAVYADSRLSALIGWESLRLAELDEGENEIVINFGNNYSGVGSVKFMMFNSVTSSEPIMKNFIVSK